MREREEGGVHQIALRLPWPASGRDSRLTGGHLRYVGQTVERGMRVPDCQCEDSRCQNISYTRAKKVTQSKTTKGDTS